MIRSASLTFISLLAVVPLSALLISVLSYFGYFENLFRDLQEFFLARYFPSLHTDMISAIETFVFRARSLGILGLLFFILTSFLLLNNINLNFNAVWGSSSKKNAREKFATYIAVFLAGTLLIATGFIFSFVLKTASRNLTNDPYSFVRILTHYVAPRIFTFVTFFLLIYLVPSGYVRFSSAVIGSVMGVLGWEIAKFLFIFSTTRIVQMSRIYGTLAAIPLFLIWLYTAWGIALYALEAAYVFQHRSRGWMGKFHERLMPRGQLILGIRVYLHIADSYVHHDLPASRRNLAELLGLSESEVEYITSVLEQKELIAVNTRRYPRYFPLQPLGSLSLADVIEALYGNRSFQEGSKLDELSREAADNFCSRGTEAFNCSTILDIIEIKELKSTQE